MLRCMCARASQCNTDWFLLIQIELISDKQTQTHSTHIRKWKLTFDSLMLAHVGCCCYARHNKINRLSFFFACPVWYVAAAAAIIIMSSIYLFNKVRALLRECELECVIKMSDQWMTLKTMSFKCNKCTIWVHRFEYEDERVITTNRLRIRF